MTPYLFFISPVFMAIALLASLTLYLRNIPKEPYLKFFPFFLFLNLIVETVSDYEAFHNENNVSMSNLFTVVVFCYYLFTLRVIIRNAKLKKALLYLVPAYFLLSLLNIFLIQKLESFHSMTYSVGCLLIVVCCIYYFFELFQRTHSVNLLRQPAFWICSGLLFYYVCSFPVLALLNFIRNVPAGILRNLLAILVLLNIFLYLSFTIAFLCRLKTRKSIS